MGMNSDQTVEQFNNQRKELTERWPGLIEFLSRTAVDYPSGG